MKTLNPYPLELQMLAERLGGRNRVAILLDVDRSRITRWLKRDMPDLKNQTKIDGLHYIMSRLLRRFKPATAQKWLLGINAFLGDQRPMDLIPARRISPKSLPPSNKPKPAPSPKHVRGFIIASSTGIVSVKDRSPGDRCMFRVKSKEPDGTIFLPWMAFSMWR